LINRGTASGVAQPWENSLKKNTLISKAIDVTYFLASLLIQDSASKRKLSTVSNITESYSFTDNPCECESKMLILRRETIDENYS